MESGQAVLKALQPPLLQVLPLRMEVYLLQPAPQGSSRLKSPTLERVQSLPILLNQQIHQECSYGWMLRI
jgi:hypothetical protein